MAEDSRSSAGETEAWVRWAMPSVPDLVFVALLGALLLTPLSVRLLGDAGIGWHIRAGQQIVATHAVPRTDPFSSSTAGKTWFAWEWLYDVIVGELETQLGLNGVVWFSAIVIAAVFAWLLHLMLARGLNLCLAFGLLLFSLSASMIHFLARPHVLSWLFALAWFHILDTSEGDCLSAGAKERRRLWILPVLMLVWVNVHGGFLLGFVLLGIFWLGGVWTWLRNKGGGIEQSFAKIQAGKHVRHLTWIAVVSFAASPVNPYGWRLYRHIYSYLSDRFLINHIEEFQSPNFHGLAQRFFAILLLFTVAAVAIRGRTLRASHLLTVLFAVYAGLYSARNIPVSAILLAMVLASMLRSRTEARGFFHRMQVVDARSRGHLWPVVATVAAFLIAANGGKIESNALMDAHFDPKRMPVEAVHFLETNNVKGPLLSPDFWGGYLIYRLYPKNPVVVDDRHDLYGEAFFKSYLKMMRVEDGWQEFLQQHEAACLILPRGGALANILLQNASWRPKYQDEVAVVFLPSGSLPSASLPGR